MHARYYSPNLGRFLSVDPEKGRRKSSQSWNRNAYVGNNPLKNLDPTGKVAVLMGDLEKVLADIKNTVPVELRMFVRTKEIDGKNDGQYSRS